MTKQLNQQEDFSYRSTEAFKINPTKRNVLDLQNETCKNLEKRNVIKNSTHDTLKQYKSSPFWTAFIFF